MKTFPVIKLEVQEMKHTLSRALSDHFIEMDAYVQQALEHELSDENIKNLINEITHREVQSAISESISEFFKYGNGKKAIKSAVDDLLNVKINVDNITRNTKVRTR